MKPKLPIKLHLYKIAMNTGGGYINKAFVWADFLQQFYQFFFTHPNIAYYSCEAFQLYLTKKNNNLKDYIKEHTPKLHGNPV